MTREQTANTSQKETLAARDLKIRNSLKAEKDLEMMQIFQGTEQSIT